MKFWEYPRRIEDLEKKLTRRASDAEELRTQLARALQAEASMQAERERLIKEVRSLKDRLLMAADECNTLRGERAKCCEELKWTSAGREEARLLNERLAEERRIHLHEIDRLANLVEAKASPKPRMTLTDQQCEQVLAMVNEDDRLWTVILQQIHAQRERSVESLTAPLCTKPEFQRGYTAALEDLKATLENRWQEARKASS